MESVAGNNLIRARKYRSARERASRSAGKNNKPVSRRDLTYDRKRDLPGLIALWPWEIEDESLQGHRKIVDLLQRALRLERKRGIGRHWTYDVARHARLLAAYRAESAALNARLRASARETAKRHEQTGTNVPAELQSNSESIGGLGCNSRAMG